MRKSIFTYITLFVGKKRKRKRWRRLSKEINFSSHTRNASDEK